RAPGEGGQTAAGYAPADDAVPARHRGRPEPLPRFAAPPTGQAAKRARAAARRRPGRPEERHRQTAPAGGRVERSIARRAEGTAQADGGTGPAATAGGVPRSDDRQAAVRRLSWQPAAAAERRCGAAVE